jgi:NADH-quinone oxidoreductase subunit L
MFFNLALLIPILPALGWLLITLFRKVLPERTAAWLATTMIALAAVLSIGLFVETLNAAPRWDAEKLQELYLAEKAEKKALKLEKEAKAAEAKAEGKTEAKTEAKTATDAAHSEGEHGGDKAGHGGTHHSPEIQALIDESLRIPGAQDFPFVKEYTWLALKGEEALPFGLYVDQIAAIMLMMVAVVATFIHLFSIGYMAGDERYATFFSYINLFAAAMLAMVLAKNLFHVLLFWEIMGLMSYLLIGFFYKKKSAQQAQKKAFMTVRVGDLAFMAGLFWLYQLTGTLDIPTLIANGESGALATTLGMGAATGIGLLLFLAAVGKSAQFPLHVWLPDAMEGPTPVSAMIHAATMVAAGVYLVARAYPIMEAGDALTYVAWIGGFTALFAATMAPAMADAKKIMAFSTLSQLGYMFLGLGVFGYTAALFHLLTHAFFKALLFLGSGSMIHGSGTQDVFEMHKLYHYQRWTFWTVLLGALSLMGFPLTAGFWSKDEILHAAQANAPLFLMGAAAAVLTAFYTTRMMIIAFFKPKSHSPFLAAEWNNNGEASLDMTKAEVEADKLVDSHGHHGDDAHGEHHPHESGPEMIIPLVFLAIAATVMGFSGSPMFGHWFQTFVYFGIPEVVPVSEAVSGYFASLGFVIIGAGLAFLLYGGNNDRHLKQRAPLWLTRLLQRRYFIDDFYYKVVTQIAQMPAAIANAIDQYLVDKLVDGTGLFARVMGDVLRRLQTGSVQWYAGLVIIGAAVMALAFTYAGGGK